MFVQSDLFLQFWRVLDQINILDIINQNDVVGLLLVLRLGAVYVVDVLVTFLVGDHLGVIVEEHAHRLVRHDVPQTVLCRVVHPLLDINLINAFVVFDRALWLCGLLRR